MKTVCPHCHQKYDVPDDYLQQDVTCQKCEKDFTVTQAKFCIKCGKANPAQALQCYACQQVFETAVKNASIRITPPHGKAESEESENADFDASVTPHWSGYLALGLGIRKFVGLALFWELDVSSLMLFKISYHNYNNLGVNYGCR